MGGIKKAFWFKIVSVLIIQLFIVSAVPAFALDLDERNRYDQAQERDGDFVNTKIAMLEFPVNALIPNENPAGVTAEDNVDYSVVVRGLDGCDLKIKCSILKASGASETDAALVLVGNGCDVQEVVTELVAAGYDAERVTNFLANIIERQDNSQNPTLQLEVFISNNIVQQLSITEGDNLTEDQVQDFINSAVSDQVQQWASLSDEDKQAIISQMNTSQKRELFLGLGGESSGLQKLFGLRKASIRIVSNGNNYTSEDNNNLVEYITLAADYMSDLGYDVSLPQTINLGNSAGSNSGTSETWNLKDVDFAVVVSKVAQTSLRESHSNLGYVGIEALSGFFTELIAQENGQTTVLSSGETFVYNPDFEGLDNNTMSQAYDDLVSGKITQEEFDEIATNVANNHRAISQSLCGTWDALNDDQLANEIVQATLDLLKGTSNPDSAQILNTCLKADEQITGGANQDVILDSFSAHGIDNGSNQTTIDGHNVQQATQQTQPQTSLFIQPPLQQRAEQDTSLFIQSPAEQGTTGEWRAQDISGGNSTLGEVAQNLVNDLASAEQDTSLFIQSPAEQGTTGEWRAMDSRSSYQQLADSGLSDEEIITQLKNEGISALDILKAATALDRDMIGVAKGMLSAGFSKMEIAKAYIAKAADWVVDNTINVINCAVQAFDAFLTNVGNQFSSKEEMAYELIVHDVLVSGGVVIDEGDIMTSMLAVKNLANEYGIALDGYNLTMETLIEMDGNAIIHIDGDHWVSVVDIEGDMATIVDNGQTKQISLSELEARWDGNALIVNEKGTNLQKLNDLQMRSIRGGRNVIRSIRKEHERVRTKFEAETERINAKVQELQGVDKLRDDSNFFSKLYVGTQDSVMMLQEGIEGYKHAGALAMEGKFSESWDTLCVAQYKFNGNPSQVWMNCMSEDDAREVGKVVKPIITAVCTIIGGCMAGEEGAAVGAFVGTLISAMFDYDMQQMAKNDDTKNFMEAFEKVAAYAVVAAACAYCFSWAGDKLGSWWSGEGATEGATGAGGSLGGGTGGAGSSGAAQTSISQALQQYAKQTAVNHALNYGLEATGVDNPYVRAVIIAVAGAYAGSEGWDIDASVGQSMTEAAASGLAMEAVRQAGEEHGWDPTLTECAALAVGTVISAAVEAGFEKKSETKPENKKETDTTKDISAETDLNSNNQDAINSKNAENAQINDQSTDTNTTTDTVIEGLDTKPNTNTTQTSNTVLAKQNNTTANVKNNLTNTAPDFSDRFVSNMKTSAGDLCGAIAGKVAAYVAEKNGAGPEVSQMLSAIAKSLAKSSVDAGIDENKEFSIKDVRQAFKKGGGAAIVTAMRDYLVDECGMSKEEATNMVYVATLSYDTAAFSKNVDKNSEGADAQIAGFAIQKAGSLLDGGSYEGNSFSKASYTNSFKNTADKLDEMVNGETNMSFTEAYASVKSEEIMDRQISQAGDTFSNILKDTETKMHNVQKPGISVLGGEVDPDKKKTIILIHGAWGDPTYFQGQTTVNDDGTIEYKPGLLDAVPQEEYNVVFLTYDFTDSPENSGDQINEMIVAYAEAHPEQDITLGVSCYGNIPTMRAVLSADESEQAVYDDMSIIQFTPTFFGSETAKDVESLTTVGAIDAVLVPLVNVSKKLVLPLITTTLPVGDFNTVVNTMDPEGANTQYLSDNYAEFESKMGSVSVLAITNDRHMPTERSSAMANERYENFVTDRTELIPAQTDDGHREFGTSAEAINRFRDLLKNQ